MDGFAPGVLHHRVVAQQVADAERWHARLTRAEEVAGTTQPQIALGDLEAVVVSVSALSRSRPCSVKRRLIQEDAVRLVRAAADTAAQLVQLRQSETFGVLDDHDRRVGHVDADLDHGRRDEDVELAADERIHHAILDVLLQTAVQERDAEVREIRPATRWSAISVAALRSTFADSSTSG